eukprot:TRINITY_DN5722_c0_g1_i1.p1 TRINITY_DN5722_c0_g1~~TRINITY_DN5722_c0_g1_i1.p1  ORF type:complete len:731 (+),score=147.65 TRINITY_DN5722_c0_g1_i1:281-2194(+)
MQKDGSRSVFSDEELIQGQHIEEVFSSIGSRVLGQDPDFVKKVVKRASEIRKNHPVLVLGHCGVGKSSLCNFLRKHEEPKALTGATDATTVGAHAYQLPIIDSRASLSPASLQSRTDFDILTDESSAGDDEIREDALKPNILLIDTEGWTFDKAKSIHQAYTEILRQRGIDEGLTPNTVLFVMSASHMREAKQDIAKMKKAFAAFDKTSQYPVTVIPVVTHSDSLSTESGERTSVCDRAVEIARDAFASTRADLKMPLMLANVEGHADAAHQQLRQSILQVVKEQTGDKNFRRHWLTAMAKDLVIACQDFLNKHPDLEPEWALFKASRRAMAGASGQLCIEDGHQSVNMLPPWHCIEHLPRQSASDSPNSWSSELLFGSLRMRFLTTLPCYSLIIILVLAIFAALYTLRLSQSISEDAAFIGKLRHHEAELSHWNHMLLRSMSREVALIHQLRHHEAELSHENHVLLRSKSREVALIHQLRHHEASLEDKDRSLNDEIHRLMLQVPASTSFISDDGSGPWAMGSEADKAWDGDPSTFYDAKAADGGYTAADLGSAHSLGVIAYIARSGQAPRMVGGRFQGANDLNGAWQTLHFIAAQPKEHPALNHASVLSNASFQFIRYLSPDGGHCNIAEIQIFL